jgi:hypothetical protein
MKWLFLRSYFDGIEYATNLPFKNSDVGLLLGAEVLGLCPDFELEAFKCTGFSI